MKTLQKNLEDLSEEELMNEWARHINDGYSTVQDIISEVIYRIRFRNAQRHLEISDRRLLASFTIIARDITATDAPVLKQIRREVLHDVVLAGISRKIVARMRGQKI